MPTNWPLLTVIVNTHAEAALLLPRALDSVLAQTYKTFELILVCDGPPNKELMEILDIYDPKFEAMGVECSFLPTEEKFGAQAGPKNWATYHSRGAYIAYLDGDNEWLPTHLERLMEAMREGEVWPDFAYCRRRYVRDEGAPTHSGDVELLEGDSPFVPWNEEAVKRLATNPLNNFIDTSDFIVSKGALYNKIFNTGWAWNERHRRFGDWILMTEGVCFSGWRGKAVEEILSVYHWTGGNISLTRAAHEGVGMEPIKA